MRKNKAVKGKKKVSAKKQIYDGIEFDSSLEVYCYKKLIENKIKFKYTPITFQVIDGFTFNNESWEPDKRKGDLLSKRNNKSQSIKYTPDFVGINWIIETKGRQNESFPLRWKLFKRYLVENDLNYELFLPKNQKQVDQAIEIIKKK